MRAAVQEQFGEPTEVLRIRDEPTPGLRSGFVRVRMLASPINPSDLMMVRGVYSYAPPLPATPGFEGVGIVEESGGGLIGWFQKGKRVAVASQIARCWAEQVVIPATAAVPIPASLSLEQAASAFVNPTTAYAMTQRVLNVLPQEWLLQTAAASVVGKMVIALGKHFGFRTINAVRREDQVPELKVLGADEVVVTEKQMRITAGYGVRCALDPVGGETGTAVAKCLAPGGRMLVHGSLSLQPTCFQPRELLTKGAKIESFALGRFMQRLNLIQKLGVIRAVNRLTESGVLRSPEGNKFPLDRIAEAVSDAERPGRGGKTLLIIAES
jgi:NADPH:quinone reductase-like Zn-dependent oxidoreductase